MGCPGASWGFLGRPGAPWSPGVSWGVFGRPGRPGASWRIGASIAFLGCPWSSWGVLGRLGRISDRAEVGARAGPLLCFVAIWALLRVVGGTLSTPNFEGRDSVIFEGSVFVSRGALGHPGVFWGVLAELLTERKWGRTRFPCGVPSQFGGQAGCVSCVWWGHQIHRESISSEG